ncbi:Uncharacterised protein [Vibrio cholerae]|nr:Uncharacterised protein [Vibrio cholerae]CSI74383.1 Uncharacterised protein [Vibrio cholerae]
MMEEKQRISFSEHVGKPAQRQYATHHAKG